MYILVSMTLNSCQTDRKSKKQSIVEKSYQYINNKNDNDNRVVIQLANSKTKSWRKMGNKRFDDRRRELHHGIKTLW